MMIDLLLDLKGLFIRDTVEYEGVSLPPKNLRFCGDDFKDDGVYYGSGVTEGKRLSDLGLCGDSRLLDVGCGSGRLATGLLELYGDYLDYLGVDVDPIAVSWCRRHITRNHPSYNFMRLDVENIRYNPKGRPLDDKFFFPLFGGFDMIYAYSLFSHMLSGDVKQYLREFGRLLKDDGLIFLSAFIEDVAPDVTVNPDCYIRNWVGPLHCVRYSKPYFLGLVDAYDFKVIDYEHGVGVDQQTHLTLKKKDGTETN